MTSGMDPSPLPGRQPRALRNTLAIIEEVVAAGPGVTAKEISAALKLPPATTYRLLNLLVGEEYLVRLPDLRGFARSAAGPPGWPLPPTPAHLRPYAPLSAICAATSGGASTSPRSPPAVSYSWTRTATTHRATR
ncbi:helix-turn-helix domain-containing protein [Fodinicola feengrottensis]|uniref:helix-turn-helix domain-containing protein n=1 Tax=Fodinicola feengrottensis TaxID=435914 RepID=UPI0024416221|nr:helix-turn-helix domain-containing protein [Fodinicola feengrottensis]